MILYGLFNIKGLLDLCSLSVLVWKNVSLRSLPQVNKETIFLAITFLISFISQLHHHSYYLYYRFMSLPCWIQTFKRIKEPPYSISQWLTKLNLEPHPLPAIWRAENQHSYEMMHSFCADPVSLLWIGLSGGFFLLSSVRLEYWKELNFWDCM